MVYTADISGFFRVVFIIILVWWLLKVTGIGRFISRMMMKGAVNRVQKKMEDQMKSQGQWNGQRMDSSYSQDIPGPDEVEDVDYEEIKD